MSIWQVLDDCNTKTRMLFFCQHIGEFQVLQIHFQHEYSLQMRCISNQYPDHESPILVPVDILRYLRSRHFNAVKELRRHSDVTSILSHLLCSDYGVVLCISFKNLN